MHTKKRTTRQHDRRCLVDTREPKNHVRKIMKQVISIVRIMARLTYAILGPGHFLLRIMQLHCNYIAISWKGVRTPTQIARQLLFFLLNLSLYNILYLLVSSADFELNITSK